MSWDELKSVLDTMYAALNSGQMPPSPNKLWVDHHEAILHLQSELNSLPNSSGYGRLKQELIDLGGVVLPRSYEILRILGYLRQRWDADSSGRALVGQMRAEAVLRETPTRDLSIERIVEMTPPQEKLRFERLAHIGDKLSYSLYQVDGWYKVLRIISGRGSLITLAPTGSGKTEVFLLPVIDEIGTQLQRAKSTSYVFIYPRVELLKDQVARIFYAAYRFQQRHGGLPIVIGLQFSGIRSDYKETLDEKQDKYNKSKNLFKDGVFQVVKTCPVCSANNSPVLGQLFAKSTIPSINSKKHWVVPLECDQCGATFYTSLGRNDHAETKPNILVTTIESLDGLYLNPDHNDYLQQVDGIVLDEIHLFHSLYGAHVAQLLRRLENMKGRQKPLVKIGASATVPEPEVFAAKLFGTTSDEIEVHDARYFKYPKAPSGLENLYFVKAADTDDAPVTQSTLIQTAMSLAHGILRTDERAIVFTESVDNATRIKWQLINAETSHLLWRFRTIQNELRFQVNGCPATTPADCSHVYALGECWRGLHGGIDCWKPNPIILERDIRTDTVTSKGRADLTELDIAVATSSLEVGIDDENIRSTIHYRPPSSVFSFTQRRGRSGRKYGDISYTIVVLGNEAADEFYFRRRNRLIAGKFRLPLNTDNEVVQQMHETLQRERDEIMHLKESYTKPVSILIWMLSKYRACSTLRSIPFLIEKIEEYYINTIGNTANNREIQRIQDGWRNWIGKQREYFRNYLQLRTLAQELVEAVPDALTKLADSFRTVVEDYLSGQEQKFAELQQLSYDLKTGLSNLANATEDEDEEARYLRLRYQVNNIKKSAQIAAFQGVDIQQIVALHDFFALLDDALNHNEEYGAYTILYVPAMTRLVLQSLFHLGTACLTKHVCKACIDHYIPSAYFQETKPILVEASTDSEEIPKQLESEDSTALGSMLIPYKPFYRYFNEYRRMTLVRTEHRTEWVDKTTTPPQVKMRIVAEGIPLFGGLSARKIYVKDIRLDDQETRTARLCESCYAVWDEEKTVCKCGARTTLARFNATPIITRTARVDPNQGQMIYTSFAYHGLMQGITRIHGASVEYRQVDKRPTKRGMIYKARDTKRSFEAIYHSRDHAQPLIYTLRTRGITWDLNGIIRLLQRNIQLRETLLSYDKEFSNLLVLHTAAHMLHKAIAALSGVNQQVLEYAYDSATNTVIVWERYEGGAGISEIVRDLMISEPVAFYHELLSSVLCPVSLAEDTNWITSSQLRERLEAKWALNGQHSIEFLDELINETMAQRSHSEAQNLTTCLDGCPACIHTTNCTSRSGQIDEVSRHVGEAIMDYILWRTDHEQLEGSQDFSSVEYPKIDSDVPIVLRF